MRRLSLLVITLLLAAPETLVGEVAKPLYGVGHVVVHPEKHGAAGPREIQAALDLAEHCRESGLNHVNLLGPLLFRYTDIDASIESLVAGLHEKGLTVSFCINTFLDREKRNREFAWRDFKGNAVGEEYFCMAAARTTRVPEIKRCIEKGVQAGFDGVLLDFLDWGTENDGVCFCDTCVREFGAHVGKTLRREQLAEQLFVDDSLVPAWWEWKMKVRNDIAAELAKCAGDAASRHKRDFWAGQCAGRPGSEPEYCGGIFAIHAPMTYGSKAAATIESYEEITKAYQSWRRRVPKAAKVVALLNCGLGDPPPEDVPAGELRELAKAAVKGGADGWIFLPAARLADDDWRALADCARLPEMR